MAREIDESWIEEAIERYRRLEALRGEYEKAVTSHSVTVRSPDSSIEMVVTAAGEITEVRLAEVVRQRSVADLEREIQAVVTDAADAARWARAKLHGEIFGKSHTLGED